MVELVDGETRRVTWPANDFRVVRTGGAHDLVVLDGVEPHLAWPLYVACARQVVDAARLRRRRHASAPPPTPSRTRACRSVVGSTADAELARRLGLSAPSYQGVTGLIGVLHVELERAGVPTISLRVGVPHYLGHTRAPARRRRPRAPPRPRARRPDRRRPRRRRRAVGRPARRGRRRRRPAAGLRPHARGRVRPPRRGDRSTAATTSPPLRGVPARPAG